MFDQLSEKLTSAFRALGGRGRLSEANIAGAMREVRVALLQADVSLEVAREFVDAVKTRALGREVLGSLSPGQAVIAVVREELVRLMGEENDALNLAAAPPAGILLAGLQGAGKTTTAGKLARLLIKRERKRVLLASADVHRPAAAEQLQLLAEAAGAEFFAVENMEQRGAVEIAAAARDAARAMSADVVLVDTAGRLHIDAEMMKELRGIHAALQPVETLFVADSMAGQDAVATARAFDRELALTGVVLTKTDGDARGGAALAIRRVTGKPIKFLGAGEGLDALEPFHPERVASRILGMGDVLTLVEEVEQKVGRERAEKAAAKIAKGRGFDLEDFREQLRQIENLGGMSGILEKLPGGIAARLPKDALEKNAGKQAARSIAIINSMTPHERRFPAVLRGSRKKRIARGAGAQVQEVNRLLKQFLQMQKMMKRAGKKGGMQQMMAQLQRGGMPR